jgi:hypothetical protein
MLSTMQTIAMMARPPVAGIGTRNAHHNHTLIEPLYAYRMRNHALDAAFYDVGAITTTTIERLHNVPFAEGGILVVHPGRNDRLSFHRSPAEFRRLDIARPRTIAVAGVGSSAVGTAAFAKNVAEAVDAPVAGVVSGYGMKDLLWEALGGWFWFRTLNQLRHSVDARAKPFVSHNGGASSWADGISPDTTTLADLFCSEEPLFDVIIGHSKGNLSIAEALYEAQDRAPAAAKALLHHAHIITVSAAIYMPDDSRRVTDIIGGADWFGRMNSHPDVTPDITVPGAWHHTNTEWPAHLNVTDAVRRALTNA